MMLELQGISKKMAGFALEEISFGVKRGDYFILLGESGAGKSMLLETIAGLIHPDRGKILLAGRDITREKIQHRRIGLVFQDHAVFPHLNVRENISYALHGTGAGREQKNEKVGAIAAELGIGHLLDRHPATLSGGELQRVALGRTLVQEPAVLLLDEPLSSLDTGLKSDLRRLLRSIHRKGQTILHVTHDYEEALSLGTRIAVIHRGCIVQSGTPAEVFHHPGSEFVARFIGVDNFFATRLSASQDGTVATIGVTTTLRTQQGQPGDEGFVLIRGEDIFLSRGETETSALNNYRGKVTEIVPGIRGSDVTVDIGVELHALVTPGSVRALALTPGETCMVHFKATAVRFISKEPLKEPDNLNEQPHDSL